MSRKRSLIVSIAAAVALIGSASAYVWWNYDDDDDATAASSEPAFITIDDGKTFLAVSGDSLPPFEYKGRIAYRAWVFTCDDGRTKWVGFLERYSDRAKALTEEIRKQRAKGRGSPALAQLPELLAGSEVKRPGESQWVKRSDSVRATAVTNIRCPDDPGRPADLVVP